jgi:hypothetical protein
VLYTGVLALLAAAAGFMLGSRRLRWAGMAAGIVLAFLSAFVLLTTGLGAGIGIPAVAAVLAISQVAYLVGLMRSRETQGARFLPDQEVDDVPDGGCDGDVSHEHEGQQESPFRAVEIKQPHDMHPSG